MTEENRELETVSGGTAPEETAADTPMPAQPEAAAETAEAPESAAEPDGLEPADLGSDTIAAEPLPEGIPKKETAKKLLKIAGMAVPPLLLLAAAALVIYYILCPSKGEFHADCTDTIYWAKATFDSGKLISPDFTYACLLPFGGSLLMLIFMPFFGLSMTTHMLGMLLFFLLLTLGLCWMLREMHFSKGWVCGGAAIFLTLLCASKKLREIFWGHTIYYSLGILFLFVGMALLFRLQNLTALRKNDKKLRTHKIITFAVFLVFFMLCCTDQISAITIFALPMMAGIFLERLLDRRTPFCSKRNGKSLILLLALGAAMVAGMKLSALWADGVTGGYADAYSNWTAQSEWLGHIQGLPLAWMNLLGLEDIGGENLMSGKSIVNLIRMGTAILLAALPIAATCCYPKYKGTSGRQMHILLWAHWAVSALVLVGYICGALSAANWRLSPIVCTSAIVSIAFLHWAIAKRTPMQRMAMVLCIPVICFCTISAWNVVKLPRDAEKVNVQYQLAEMLEEQGLDYGYATFWRANSVTVISDDAVKVRSVSVDETNGVTKYYYQTAAEWYTAQPDQDKYFLLLDSGEYDTLVSRGDALLSETTLSFSWTDSYGGQYQVLVFDHNIF